MFDCWARNATICTSINARHKYQIPIMTNYHVPHVSQLRLFWGQGLKWNSAGQTKGGCQHVIRCIQKKNKTKKNCQLQRLDSSFSITALQAILIWSSAPGYFVSCHTDVTHPAACPSQGLHFNTRTGTFRSLINKQTKSSASIISVQVAILKTWNFHVPFMNFLNRIFAITWQEKLGCADFFIT